MTVREFLKKSVLLFDGAMGTLYAERAAEPLEKCEEGNLSDPELIKRIHREYINAGARAIKTNTYGANRVILECGGGKLEKIIKAAWTLAAEAAQDRDVFIFASIGPIPEIAGKTGRQYREIVDIFLKLGAENFLFETFGNSEPILETAKYIREKLPEAFIIGSYAVNPDGFSVRGERGTALLDKTLDSSLVDAAGFNCVSGPANLKKLAAVIPTEGRLITIMPNASFPTVVGNRTIFGNNPSYFADQVKEIAAGGVKILGGCCGTNPEYIREVSRRIEGFRAFNVIAGHGSEKREPNRGGGQNFLRKLNRGEKIIAVELDPPENSEFEKYLKGASELDKAGADLITIADCPVARSRMDSSIIACKLRRELGIEPLPHLTCRDRNLNATKGLLLGLNMEGVEQVLVVTGDPVPNSERNAVKSVFNFNSRMLATYISELGETVFERPFYICAALNVNARNFDAQLRLAEKKAKAGVKMLFTQPVLSEQAGKNLKKAKESLDVKIMGGIMPVVSYRNACFMNNEISGMIVSDDIVRRYRDKDKAECTRLAVEISSDIARSISDIVDGYYIITPFSRTDIVCEIISSIKMWEG